MSNLSSFSVINEKVDKIYKEEKTSNKGEAFARLCLATILNLNDEEIEESLTDGSMDGEVDAIYINGNVVNIMTFKYTDDYKNSTKNYPESELDQYMLTLGLLIEGSLDFKTINAAVWNKYEEIKSLLKQKNKQKIEFKIFVISNKEEPVAHAKKKMKNLTDKYRLDEAIYFNQEKLDSYIIENKTKKINGHLQLLGREHFEKSNGNIRTVIGAIAATDLIRMIADSENENQINESAFNSNVRVYKPKHPVNKAIRESAKSETNFQFFYLNNGITILCEEVDYMPNTISPVVKLKNLQIINGGQTTHSLFDVYKSDLDRSNLETIELLVRICQAKKEDPISEKISETSNSQIPVGSRDIHSNDRIQKQLEEQFKTLGYYYERKPNQYIDKPKAKVLNNELLAQLYMSYYLEKPSEAKNDKAKVFGDHYDSIFNENEVTAKKLLSLYDLYLPLLASKKEIQKKRRKKEQIKPEESFKSWATFHILFGLKFLFEKEEAKIRKAQGTTSQKEKLVDALFLSKKDVFIKKVTKLIYEVIKQEQPKRGEEYSHDKFFKEAGTNDLIKKHIVSKK